MAVEKTEAEQLELLNRIEVRILLDSNNERLFSQKLDRYLVAFLLKLDSPHERVRREVLGFASKLKTFAQPDSVILPVAALLKQYKETKNAVLKQVDLMFILQGLGRLDKASRSKLMPTVISGMDQEWVLPTDAEEGHYGPSAAGIFNVFLRLLHDVEIPQRGSKESVSFKEDMGLDHIGDAIYVATGIASFVRLKQGAVAEDGLTNKDSWNGLLEWEVKLFNTSGNQFWTGKDGVSVAETKIRAMKFIASEAFVDEEKLVPAICAAGSPDARIRSIGEELLKKSTADLDNELLVVKPLYKLARQLPPEYLYNVVVLLSKSDEACKGKYSVDMFDIFKECFDIEDGEDERGMRGFKKPTGLLKTRLQQAAFVFMRRMASQPAAEAAGNRLRQQMSAVLRANIDVQGWPSPEPTTQGSALEMRGKAYEMLGLLGAGADTRQTEALAELGFLFRSLREDRTPGIGANIESAISSIAPRFKHTLGKDVDLALRTILLNNLCADEVDEDALPSRLSAVKMANASLPFADPTSRWIDILAVAGRQNPRSDVVEEGKKGLDPWTVALTWGAKEPWPNWARLAETFFLARIPNVTAQANQKSYLRSRVQYTQAPRTDDVAALVNFAYGERMGALPVAVTYCTQLLFLAVLHPDQAVERDWERQVEARLANETRARDQIRRHLREAASDPQRRHGLRALLDAAFRGMVLLPGNYGLDCARCFVSVASLCPAETLQPFAKDMGRLVPLATSNQKEGRSLAARAFGLLWGLIGAHADATGKAFVDKLAGWKTAAGPAQSRVQGVLLTLSYVLSRQVWHGAALDESVKDVYFALADVFDDVGTVSPNLQDVIFECMAHVWTAGIYMPAKSLATKGLFTEKILTPLVEAAKNSNEKAITALGRIALINFDNQRAFYAANDVAAPDVGGDDDIPKLVLEKLKTLHEIKRPETHFAVGEAFAATVAGWGSDSVRLSVDVDTAEVEARGVVPVAAADSARVEAAVADLLEATKNTKPALLKASAIWLFCLVQNCSHVPEVQAKLRECQAAFMRLLFARDPFVQETASRGLTLVYERGDDVLKKTLVADLVGAFTGSGAPTDRMKVDDETELFEAGALPTAEGQSVTSYRDIVNLANEVGDQSLVYKFMNLANNAATWSSRSAFGRFGLGNVLSESEMDPKLYVKLFRYRFDPNKGVQKSMEDIWKAVAKDSAAVVDKYFDDIMADLLESMWTKKEWRTRQASCLAVADLIQGQPFVKYEKYYADIWTRAAKVMDDVKTSVRNAAIQLCIGLSHTLVRQLEESGTSAATKAMTEQALPFLLNSGMDSPVEEVKQVSTVTVLRIAKSGGAALKPYIPDMVPSLLAQLGAVDVQAINRAYIRADDESKEKLDKLRTSLVSRSPVSDAIDQLLRHADGDVLAALAPNLERVVKEAISPTTKLGASRTLTVLFTRNRVHAAPFAPRFLVLLERHGLLDRNNEVSLEYAKATAYILRAAEPKPRLRFADFVTKTYFRTDNSGGADADLARQRAADATLALAKNSPDVFASLETRLLPLAFLASHDTDAYTSTAMKAAWEAGAGSNARTVLRLRSEVLALLRKGLDSPQWALQHAAALATPDAVAAFVAGAESVALGGAATGASSAEAEAEGSSSAGQAAAATSGGGAVVEPKDWAALWTVVERALALKYFARKETVLAALPGFVRHARAFWSQPGGQGRSEEGDDFDNGRVGAKTDVAAALVKIVLREAKRTNETYRAAALGVLWKVAELRDDRDWMTDVAGVAKPVLDEWKASLTATQPSASSSSSTRATASSSSSGAKSSEADAVKQTLAAAAFEALARSYHRPSLRAPNTAAATLDRILRAVAPYLDGLSATQRGPLGRTLWFAVVKDVMDEAGSRGEKGGTATEASAEPATTKAKQPADDAETLPDAPPPTLLDRYLSTLRMGADPRAELEGGRAARAAALKALRGAVERGGVFDGESGEESAEQAVEKVVQAAEEAAKGERSTVVLRELREVVVGKGAGTA